MPNELLTMHDIATLARVSRPVVTTWRRRFRASSRPFPHPRSLEGGRELFSRPEVVSWLEETEHGNNPQVRLEATVGALLNDARLGAPRNFDALSALLVIRAQSGVPLAGLDADDLLDAADALDPDDTCLLSELDRVDDPVWLAAAADELADASYTVADAHRRLLEARLPPVLSRGLLGAEAVRLLITLAGPLRRDLSSESADRRPSPGSLGAAAEATLLDVTGARFDLLAELAAASNAPVAILNGNTRSHRLNRRRLRLAGVVPKLIEAATGWSVDGPTLALAVLPSPAQPLADEAAQLALIDDLALQLTDEQAALALAPAAVLTDPLSGEAGARRDQLLRSGQVRAIVRLPAGLVPGQVRQAMGLWLLTAADPAASAERRTMVGDLSRPAHSATAADALPPAVVDGLASDLLAARLGEQGARLRAWASLHPVFTAALLAGDGSLVPPRPALPARPDALSGADWVIRLSDPVAARLPGRRLQVADGRPQSITLGQAEQRGWLRVLTGRRFDPSPLVSDDPSATVRVWTPADLAEPRRPRRVGRLELHSRTDPVFTEPGDLVFVNRPQPLAVLDADGGAAVFAPVRILRVRPGAPLVAAALVDPIAAQPNGQWRAWVLPQVAQPEPLAQALAELAAQREELLAELTGLDRFRHDLITAAESGRLSITKENHGHSQG